MDLRTYLIDRDGRVSKDGDECKRVAEASGLSPYYLAMVALGHKQLSPEKAHAVHLATDGDVTRNELLPDFPWDAPKAAA